MSSTIISECSLMQNKSNIDFICRLKQLGRCTNSEMTNSHGRSLSQNRIENTNRTPRSMMSTFSPYSQYTRSASTFNNNKTADKCFFTLQDSENTLFASENPISITVLSNISCYSELERYW